jgi:high-affinity iron transporter
MLAALIIVFREVFEAGLIIGIVLAVTKGVPGRSAWVTGGAAAGVAGAALVAVFAEHLSAAFAGAGQELFNAAILCVAVVMLTWHNVWMAQHGREMAAELRTAGEAVTSGTKSLSALAIVVGVAVLREGFEVVLFLFGIAASDGSSGAEIFAGSAAGLLLGALVCALTYFGLLRIPGRHLFAVTSLLIAFLAAGMAAQAVAFLTQASILTVLDQTVWDTSWLVSESSLAGRTLHTLIGYTDQPTWMQLLAYAAVLIAMAVLMNTFRPTRQSHNGNVATGDRSSAA